MTFRVVDAGRVFWDKNGTPAASGKAHFYASGTSTLQSTFSDTGLSTENANPITLNSDGRLPVSVFGNGSYTVTVKDDNGATLWSEDSVSPDVDLVSVKDFGAIGDGVNDDAAAIQATIDHVTANGGTVFVPRGVYSCSTKLNWLDTGTTHDNEYTKGGIIGSGPRSSVLKFTGTSETTTGIDISSGSTTALTFFFMKDLGLEGNPRQGRGIQIDGLAFSYFENLYVNYFEYGIYAEDLLSTTFVSCFIRLNKFGGRFTQTDASQPNAISFFGCNVANSEYGLYLIKPSTFTMSGGAMEVNGFTGTGGNHWGIKMDNSGAQGTVGATFQGVYFEKNVGTADIWIDSTTNAASYVVQGCSFNRIDSVEFTTNNIKLQASSGEQSLVVIGCGFRAFGSYTEDAARKYIDWSDAGGDLILNQIGNHFGDQVANPARNTVTDGGAIDPLATSNFIATTTPSAYTLVDGHDEGQEVQILMTVDGGDATLTPTSLGGGTTITFDDAGDFAVLRWINANWWMIGGTATLA